MGRTAERPMPSEDANLQGTTTTPGQLNIAGRLERLPLGAFHISALTIVGAALFFDGFDLIISGLSLPSLQAARVITTATRAWFISGPLLGAAFGSGLSGVLGDRFGRRRVLLANLFIYGVFSPLCGLAGTFAILLSLRTIAVFALGSQIPTAYTYLAELLPRAGRSRFQSVLALSGNAAFPVGAFIAWLLVRRFEPALAWRLLFLVSGFALPLIVPAIKVLRESPRWLSAVGRESEAASIVSSIEAAFVNRGHKLAEPEWVPPATVRSAGWSVLGSRRVRNRFLLAVLIHVCHLSAIYVLISWLPQAMLSRGISISETFALTAVSYVGAILGPVLAAYLADRWEHKWCVICAAVIAAATGLFYSIQTASFGLLITGLVLNTAIYFISATGTAIYTPEILPTAVRMRGMGFALFAGRIAAGLTPFIASAVISGAGNALIVVGGVAFLYVILAAALIAFGPNTSGRTLEALECEVS